MSESLSGVIGLALGTSKTGALELLNGTTGKVIKSIPLGAPAREVIVGSGGAMFYVLDGTAKSASVTVVNSQDGGVQGTVPMPLNTVSIAPDSLGVSVYALQPDGKVSQVADRRREDHDKPSPPGQGDGPSPSAPTARPFTCCGTSGRTPTWQR